MELQKIEGAIEAILFTMGEAVEVEKIAAAIEHDKETTRRLIRNMMDKYQAEDRGIRIIELEDSFQLCSKTEYYDVMIKIAKQPKKSCLLLLNVWSLPLMPMVYWIFLTMAKPTNSTNTSASSNAATRLIFPAMWAMNAPRRRSRFWPMARW